MSQGRIVRASLEHGAICYTDVACCKNDNYTTDSRIEQLIDTVDSA
jgi:hypothetical protein